MQGILYTQLYMVSSIQQLEFETQRSLQALDISNMDLAFTSSSLQQ